MRSASVNRQSRETQISVRLTVEGAGLSEIDTEIGFFSHMLEAFAKHGSFDLAVRARGDLHIDQHHLVEDVGLVLGQAFAQALGDRRGIERAGYFCFPMDEALAVVAVDLAGRPYLKYELAFKHERIGEFQADLIQEFFKAFSIAAGANVHVVMPYGENDHHKAESTFKAFAKAMKMACALTGPAGVPSTKGLLDTAGGGG